MLSAPNVWKNADQSGTKCVVCGSRACAFVFGETFLLIPISAPPKIIDARTTFIPKYLYNFSCLEV